MIIRGGQVMLPGEEIPVHVDVEVVDGIVARVGRDLPGNGEPDVNAEGQLVLPGVIDPHVHFNEPGYTDREDFYHGSQAAAAGGVTTVIDMPCTSVPPVTSPANFRDKLNVVSTRSVIDFGLYGGLSDQSYREGFPGAIEELAPFVLGFKAYLTSGMDTFRRVSHFQLKRLLEVAAKVDRPVLLHAEDADYIRNAEAAARAAGSTPADFYRSRPETAEILAVAVACELAEETGGELHIVHVSTSRAAEIIARAAHVTGETCPHYLAFTTEDFERIGAPLKVTPPVKREPNRTRLWEALASGVLSFAASDHAPAPVEQKHTGSVWTDYAGIPGSGTMLPYLFSEGYVKRRISLRRLVEITSLAAARRYGIDNRKGRIQIGHDGDFVLIHPRHTHTVAGDSLRSKGRVTPFEGMTFEGRVEKTIVRGRVVYDAQEGITAPPGYGRHIRREEK